MEAPTKPGTNPWKIPVASCFGVWQTGVPCFPSCPGGPAAQDYPTQANTPGNRPANKRDKAQISCGRMIVEAVEHARPNPVVVENHVGRFRVNIGAEVVTRAPPPTDNTCSS